MNKNSQKKQRFPCDYYEFKAFTGIIIIPIKNATPVLIFKDYGAPLYWEVGGPEETKKGFEERTALNNYIIYWKGKFFNHELPDSVKKEYDDFFDRLITSPLPTYFADFPKNSIEIPIPLLTSKIKIHEDKYLTDAKKILRKFNFITETRGKNKTPNKFKEHRKELIIKSYILTGRKKPYPMSQIQDLTYNQLVKEFPDLPAEKLSISDDQARRILNKYLRTSRIK